MDFGFSAALDKFEEHFGKKETKVLVGLIAVTVSVVCVGLIFSNLAPVAIWATETATGSSASWIIFKALSFLSYAVALAGGMMIFASVMDARRMMLDAETLMESTATVSEESIFVLREIKSILVDIENGAEIGDLRSSDIERVISTTKSNSDGMKKFVEKIRKKRGQD